MAYKEMRYSDDARKLILHGVNKLAEAVKITLGPQGRNVAIEQKRGAPSITKDGVTVAKGISVKDPFENMGAQMVKEVSAKTSEIAGDGTTTATVLAQAIYTEGFKNIIAGRNPMAIKKGIDLATNKLIESLSKLKRNIKGKDEIKQIATISANNDEEIGSIIAAAMDKVGDEGVVTFEDGKTFNMELEFVEGMQFDKGFLSPYFVTDSDNMVAELDDPLVLLVEGTVNNMQKLLPVLEITQKTDSPLLLISEKLENEAMATLVVNKMKGVISVCAVEAPGYGELKHALLEDIATLTGATIVSDLTGLKLEDVEEKHLGRARKTTVTKKDTTIVEGNGDKKDINERIVQIKSSIRKAENEHVIQQLRIRLAKFTSGVAVIQVGAPTEIELKEKKDRLDDALNATLSAVEEGIVIGGGSAYLKAKKDLDIVVDDPDIMLGVEILFDAIEAPLRQLLTNAGKNPEIIIPKLKEEHIDDNIGFNVLSDSFEDMFKAGVIDPFKVSRSALQNASSVASLLLTTECMIATHEEESDKQTPNPMQPGLGGMYQ